MTRLRERFPDVPMIGLDLPDPELASHWRSADICRACSATALPSRSPMTRSIWCSPSRCSSTCRAPTRALRELSRVCSGTLIASVPLEPIWRAGNLAAASLRASARQHPGPRQPLDAAGVQPLRRPSLRRRAGEEPAALDDGARPSHRLTSLHDDTPIADPFWAASTFRQPHGSAAQNGLRRLGRDGHSCQSRVVRIAASKSSNDIAALVSSTSEASSPTGHRSRGSSDVAAS